MLLNLKWYMGCFLTCVGNRTGCDMSLVYRSIHLLATGLITSMVIFYLHCFWCFCHLQVMGRSSMAKSPPRYSEYNLTYRPGVRIQHIWPRAYIPYVESQSEQKYFVYLNLVGGKKLESWAICHETNPHICWTYNHMFAVCVTSVNLGATGEWCPTGHSSQLQVLCSLSLLGDIM